MILNLNMLFRTVSLSILSASAVGAAEQGVRGLGKPAKPTVGGTCEFKGNGFPSGQDYQLQLVGMGDSKAEDGWKPRPNDDNGRSMFVNYDGRTVIDLINSSENSAACGGKDYKVVDANGVNDGTASFCLPDPFPDCEKGQDCDDVPADYAVFARVVKGGSGNTMKLCVDLAGSVSGEYCYLGTTTLSNRKATDVSKQLLTWCYDGGSGSPTGFGLFDEVCETFEGSGELENCDNVGEDEIEESYFWQLDADKLKNAQLRFYKVADLVADNPGCADALKTTRKDGCGR